jgi:hypothetical protein
MKNVLKELLYIAKKMEMIIETEEEKLSWKTKYHLIFSDALSSRFRELLSEINLSLSDYYDPDEGYEEDVTAFFEAVKLEMKEIKVIAEIYLSEQEIENTYSEFEEKNQIDNNVTEQLKNLQKKANEIYNSDIPWETKYKLIFSKNISRRFNELIEEINEHFSYYDPDSDYEDDVIAFMSAMNEKIEEIIRD